MNDGSQQRPEGWYDDPYEPDQVRWWDGERWTGHIKPATAAQQQPVDGQPAQHEQSKPPAPENPDDARLAVPIAAGAAAAASDDAELLAPDPSVDEPAPILRPGGDKQAWQPKGAPPKDASNNGPPLMKIGAGLLAAAAVIIGLVLVFGGDDEAPADESLNAAQGSNTLAQGGAATPAVPAAAAEAGTEATASGPWAQYVGNPLASGTPVTEAPGQAPDAEDFPGESSFYRAWCEPEVGTPFADLYSKTGTPNVRIGQVSVWDVGASFYTATFDASGNLLTQVHTSPEPACAMHRPTLEAGSTVQLGPYTVTVVGDDSYTDTSTADGSVRLNTTDGFLWTPSSVDPAGESATILAPDYAGTAWARQVDLDGRTMYVIGTLDGTAPSGQTSAYLGDAAAGVIAAVADSSGNVEQDVERLSALLRLVQ